MVFNIVIIGGMIARRLDEAMAKHDARNQQGMKQDFVIEIGRNMTEILIDQWYFILVEMQGNV